MFFSAVRRLKSEDHHEFSTSLGCAVNSRPALARDLHQNNQKGGGN